MGHVVPQREQEIRAVGSSAEKREEEDRSHEVARWAGFGRRALARGTATASKGREAMGNKMCEKCERGRQETD